MLVRIKQEKKISLKPPTNRQYFPFLGVSRPINYESVYWAAVGWSSKWALTECKNWDAMEK